MVKCCADSKNLSMIRRRCSVERKPCSAIYSSSCPRSRSRLGERAAGPTSAPAWDSGGLLESWAVTPHSLRAFPGRSSGPCVRQAGAPKVGAILGRPQRPGAVGSVASWACGVLVPSDACTAGSVPFGGRTTRSVQGQAACGSGSQGGEDGWNQRKGDG